MTFNFADEVDEVMNQYSQSLSVETMVFRMRLYGVVVQHFMQCASIDDQIDALHQMRDMVTEEVERLEEAS